MAEENIFQVLQPDGWSRPIGYANGIAVSGGGKLVFCAGQIGWNADQVFEDLDFVAQFGKALENIVAIVAEAGGKPEHITRLTGYCADREGYLNGRKNLGPVWKEHMGRHYPAMTLVFVSGLVDEGQGAKIELEATAFIPD